MNKPAASGDIAAETALSLAQRAREARRLVRRRAALSAAAAVLPIPGLDIAVDLAAFADMLNQINRSFALSPGQIERLHTDERIAMLSALSQVVQFFARPLCDQCVVLTAVKQLGLAGRRACSKVGAYCRSGRCCSAFLLGSSTLGEMLTSRNVCVFGSRCVHC